jgi:hypothetical protein
VYAIDFYLYAIDISLHATDFSVSDHLPSLT